MKEKNMKKGVELARGPTRLTIMYSLEFEKLLLTQQCTLKINQGAQRRCHNITNITNLEINYSCLLLKYYIYKIITKKNCKRRF